MSDFLKARQLRNSRTQAEKELWKVLRSRRLGGLKFRRQVPIGSYIADFVCFDARLIVELDGGQHAWEADKDLKRTRDLELLGFRVVRFWNSEVFENLEGVADRILAAASPEAN